MISEENDYPFVYPVFFITYLVLLALAVTGYFKLEGIMNLLWSISVLLLALSDIFQNWLESLREKRWFYEQWHAKPCFEDNIDKIVLKHYEKTGDFEKSEEKKNLRKLVGNAKKAQSHPERYEYLLRKTHRTLFVLSFLALSLSGFSMLIPGSLTARIDDQRSWQTLFDCFPIFSILLIIINYWLKERFCCVARKLNIIRGALNEIGE